MSSQADREPEFIAEIVDLEEMSAVVGGGPFEVDCTCNTRSICHADGVTDED